MDWVAYLKHLQIVFKESDLNAILLVLVLIYLFRNSLWLLIRTQTNQNRCQKDNWKQAIKKAINTEAKVALNLLSLI